MTRRDALGVFAKAGAAFGTGICFFLSLKTSPMADALQDFSQKKPSVKKDSFPNRIDSTAEKVVISGTGSTITFRISGSAGRHCGVAYATTDSREHYRGISKARGIIGRDGLGTIQINVKDLPAGKVYIRVVTGLKKDFSVGTRGTQAFVIHNANGVVIDFGGL
ncbi:MAG: hypothetical protein U5K27_09405 [Desulfotignum sp.]|nr:hypothetical protein [Desulfotignum sp.]